jgi:hypothetical protein
MIVPEWRRPSQLLFARYELQGRADLGRSEMRHSGPQPSHGLIREEV